MPKKKIAFVISSLSSGGAERVISNLSNVLIEKFQIVIITFVKSEPFYSLDERIKVIACKQEIHKSLSVFHAIKLNYLLTKGIYQILKKEKINLAIGFITSANILTTIAAKIYGIPCIISERNNPLRGDLPKFWVILRKFIYPQADKIILQTNGVKKIYENIIKADKITILPNPIASELTNLRDDHATKENLVITVGRLNKNKGQDEIIKAFGSIEVDNWKLLIIGYGDHEKDLKTLIDRLNLSNKVKIISKVKRIDEYYNKASIFLFNSKTEGFPNALLEAMHFGIPCISSNCEFGPADLIEDGINGFLIPINSETLLKERLFQLMYNKDLRDEFSKKSKLTTLCYQSETAVAHWEKLIISLLESSHMN